MTNNLKKIDANIVAVRETGDKFNALVHETAVLIMEHSIEHGDCSRAQLLVNAMPASMRRTMLIAWFTEFSPIVTRNDDKWESRLQKKETATGKPNPLYKPYDLEAAKALPFWKMAEQRREQNFVPLKFDDLVKQVITLKDRIIGQIDDGKVADEDIESAKVVARTLEDLQFSRIQAAGDSAANDDNQSQLNDLRKQYSEKYGKKAFHGWTAETIQEKLNKGIEQVPGELPKERAVA